MNLTFLGANHEVTGSRTLIECGGLYGLVDYGMEQGKNFYENAPLPVPPNQIGFVLLTHAHIDHSGWLPLLFKQGFQGSIITTDATADLCGIMLKDAAHIQMQDAEWQNKKGQRAGSAPIEPLYDLDDVEGVLKLFVPCAYGKIIDAAPGVRVRFTDIGHLLGSAALEVWLKEGDTEKKMVFSGDVGNKNQPLIRDPEPIDSADYLLIESTYGDKLHDGGEVDRAAILAACIQKTLDRGGNVVIPAFAVGRTQELLYFIREAKERGLFHGHDYFPVYVDSPLANEATTIFQNCDPSYLDDEARAILARHVNPLMFDGLLTATTSDDSKAINVDNQPKVIISASGMCDAGRIRHHLKYNLWRPESLVLFVGYQADGTLGRLLLDGADSVKILGEKVAVKAEIINMPGVSGHADRDGLLDWLGKFQQKPGYVFVNHGEDAECGALVQSIHEMFGLEDDSPFSGSVYDLITGQYTYKAQGVPVAPKEPVPEQQPITQAQRAPETPHAAPEPHQAAPDSPYWRMLYSADALLKTLHTLGGAPSKELARIQREIEALTREVKR